MIGYHTADNSKGELHKPLYCVKEDAWLGAGYYFWAEKMFADDWAEIKNYLYYDIYSAEIDKNKCIDLTDPKKSVLYYENIKKLLHDLRKKTNKKITNKTLFSYLRKKINNKIIGIMYDKAPKSKKYSELEDYHLFIVKQQQIVIFEERGYTNFKIIERKKRNERHRD
jgi:hypothetical protein